MIERIDIVPAEVTGCYHVVVNDDPEHLDSTACVSYGRALLHARMVLSEKIAVLGMESARE